MVEREIRERIVVGRDKFRGTLQFRFEIQQVVRVRAIIVVVVVVVLLEQTQRFTFRVRTDHDLFQFAFIRMPEESDGNWCDAPFLVFLDDSRRV